LIPEQPTVKDNFIVPISIVPIKPINTKWGAQLRRMALSQHLLFFMLTVMAIGETRIIFE